MKIDFVVNNMQHYDCPMKIFEDFAPEKLKNMTEDEKLFLDHIDDFEGVDYAVLNYERVVIFDCLNGDIYAVDSIDEFIKQTVEYIAENL